MNAGPIQLPSIDAAAAHICRWLAETAETRPLIAIGGPVGSGKSTLAGRLGGLVVSTDDYLPDYAGLEPHERDLPERADLSRLARDLADLRVSGRAQIPTWCFREHRRTGEREARAEGLVVVEGIFALHPLVARATDLRVLVAADRSTRWARWERIELTGQRGMGVDAARDHFDRVAEPTYERHAHLYAHGLDLVVLNEGV